MAWPKAHRTGAPNLDPAQPGLRPDSPSSSAGPPIDPSGGPDTQISLAYEGDRLRLGVTFDLAPELACMLLHLSARGEKSIPQRNIDVLVMGVVGHDGRPGR